MTEPIKNKSIKARCPWNILHLTRAQNKCESADEQTRRNCTAEVDQRDMKVQNLRSHCDADRAENCAS